jgi:hypothetical protein
MQGITPAPKGSPEGPKEHTGERSQRRQRENPAQRRQREPKESGERACTLDHKGYRASRAALAAATATRYSAPPGPAPPTRRAHKRTPAGPATANAKQRASPSRLKQERTPTTSETGKLGDYVKGAGRPKPAPTPGATPPSQAPSPAGRPAERPQRKATCLPTTSETGKGPAPRLKQES